MFDYSSPLVIYHGADCNDGYCSFLVINEFFRAVYNIEAESVPATYGTKNKIDFNDRDVFIVDFSYPRNKIQEIKQCARSLVVIDHHKTALEDLDGLDYCIFDMSKSGARLTLEYCLKVLPFITDDNLVLSRAKSMLDMLFPLVEYVEDRDLWLWNQPYSTYINAILSVIPKRVEQWKVFADRVSRFRDVVSVNVNDGIMESLYMEGSAIIRAKNKLIDSMMRHAYSPGYFNGKEIWMVNASIYFSELAGKLAGKDGIGIAWYQTNNGLFKYSLRTASTDEEIDVSAIARELGGGGHRHAAGVLTADDPDLFVSKIIDL